jgi:hypothetical protein
MDEKPAEDVRAALVAAMEAFEARATSAQPPAKTVPTVRCGIVWRFEPAALGITFGDCPPVAHDRPADSVWRCIGARAWWLAQLCSLKLACHRSRHCEARLRQTKTEQPRSRLRQRRAIWSGDGPLEQRMPCSATAPVAATMLARVGVSATGRPWTGERNASSPSTLKGLEICDLAAFY